MRDPLSVAAMAGLALGAAALAGAATWQATGRGTARGLTAAGLAAWCGAAGCGVWRRKQAADAAAEAERPAIAWARADWTPGPGAVGLARREHRPVPLAPLEAALVAGIPAPHAVAALLAEFSRSGLVRHAPGDPPALTVGPVAPADPYGRLLANAAGQAIGPAVATALATHAAAEAGRKQIGRAHV